MRLEVSSHNTTTMNTHRALARSFSLRLLAAVVLVGATMGVAGAVPVEAHLQGALHDYDVAWGPVRIRDRTIVEGSLEHGGIQPHIFVDLGHSALAPLLKLADELGRSSTPARQKADLLRQAVRKAMPVGRGSIRWHDTVVRIQRRRDGEIVSLGAAVATKAGVCREHSLLMNVLLQRAGIDAKRRYVSVWMDGPLGRRRMDHGINTASIDGVETIVDSFYDPFHGQSWSEVRAPAGIPTRRHLGLVKGATGIEGEYGSAQAYRYYVPRSPTVKTFGTFELPRKAQRPLEASVLGRTPAARLFGEQQEAFDRAGPEDFVDAEWIFAPYYVVFGHSVVRVGNKAYEFTEKGWRIHEEGQDKAEGFLFANPFFKRELKAYQREGMPPFAIAVPVRLRKSEVLRAEERIKNERWKPFALLTNNCNSALLDAFPSLRAPRETRFSLFSSLFTMRRMLAAAEAPLRLYLLPGAVENVRSHSFKNLVPKTLYGEHSLPAEFLRLGLVGSKRLVAKLGRALAGKQAATAPAH
ncbi:MAG: transglutaminase domain-containing protein [Deltaproteobacteria bacterium]|nr:transglutaminase domain-containing protein [Deltaproteobacteria bacterium]